jgi:hypothetical protein
MKFWIRVKNAWQILTRRNYILVYGLKIESTETSKIYHANITFRTDFTDEEDIKFLQYEVEDRQNGIKK